MDGKWTGFGRPEISDRVAPDVVVSDSCVHRLHRFNRPIIAPRNGNLVSRDDWRSDGVDGRRRCALCLEFVEGNLANNRDSKI